MGFANPPSALSNLVYLDAATISAASATWTLKLNPADTSEPFAGYLVLADISATSPAICYCAAIYDETIATPGQQRSPRWAAGAGPLGTGRFQIVIPSSTKVGATALARVFWSEAIAGTMYVWGLTQDPGVKLRSDGRAYPIGSLSATLTVTGTAGTVIPAPPAPLRVMLCSLSMANYGQTIIQIRSKRFGVTRRLAFAGGNPGTPATPEWRRGLLLDPAVPVTMIASLKDAIFIAATYDLVV